MIRNPDGKSNTARSNAISAEMQMTEMPVSSTAPKIKLVVAGSFSQFIDWCDENQIHPRNHRVKYVSKAEQLQGYNAGGAELVKYGTWYKRKDIAEIEEMADPLLSA